MDLGVRHGLGDGTSSASTTRTLRSLTSLRWFAALGVVLYHSCRYIPAVSDAKWVVGYGYVGVSFFFILSGFILTWTYGKARTSARQFYWRRFARVWPLHALTTVAAVGFFAIEGRDQSAALFVAALALVHAWGPPGSVHYAYNGVSWSLSCEAFFYAAFPILLVILTKIRRSIGVAAALFILAGVVVTAVVGLTGERESGFLLYVLPAFRIYEFTIGICLALAVRRGLRVTIRPAVAVILLLAAYLLVASIGPRVTGDPLDVPFGVTNLVMVPAFSLLILTAACADIDGRSGRLLNSTTLVTLGQWSFALYLVHELVLRWTASHVRLSGWVDGGLYVLGLIVVVTLVSGALSYWFERPIEVWLKSLRGTTPTPAVGR